MSLTEDKYFRKNDVVKGYSIKKIIGEGRYGIAYLASNKSGEKVVIKQLKNEMLEETREKLFYEETILRNLNNKAFPRFIDTFNEDGREGYILEYIEGRVFESLLVKGIIFKRKDIYLVCEELLDLIEILHNKSIVHRDIRLPNIIVKENRELVLIDFGLARVMDGDRYVKQMDYWYIGDFLLHLYYSTYKNTGDEEKPWYEELDIGKDEIGFLKRLLGLRKRYRSIDEIRRDLERLRRHYL